MTRALRILHVTRDFPPTSNGGLGIAVGGMVRAQVRAGFECSVVSFDNYRPTSKTGTNAEPEAAVDDAGLHVLRVGDAGALPRARELAIERAADVVHVHHGLLWDFASDVAVAIGAPTVLTPHVLQSEQNRLRGLASTKSSEAQNRALAECTLVHAPSRTVADLLTNAGPTIAQRLRVVRLGHDDWPGASEAFGKDRFAAAPRLLYVGRFADINGFGQLADALPTLLAQHADLHVTMAGGLPDSPKSERRWMRRIQGLCGDQARRVHFAGWLGKEQLSLLYGEATALLVPSWFETFGQVVLEGMLHGAPLITTSAGAIPELVDERCALVIDSMSSEAICEAVGALFADPEAANQRRRQARERVSRGMHWDDRMTEFHALYQAALEL